MPISSSSISNNSNFNIEEDIGLTPFEMESLKDSSSLSDQLLENCSLTNEHEELMCLVCNKPYPTPPRILSCLHVFCESCIVNTLLDESLDLVNGLTNFRCTMCDQVTSVKSKDVTLLPCDHVLLNLLEVTNITTSSSLCCTSCKTNEKAVARCMDCPHFLCSNCNSAHQYMRCFENHYVVLLEEVRQSEKKIPFHKPIYCDIHRKLVKLYCYTCQEEICFDCTADEHKAPLHIYDNLNTAAVKERQKLDVLLSGIKERLHDYLKTNSNLENILSDLQIQHDSAKDLINETFQSYKAILEKCRDEALDELGKLHTRQELKVMDAMQDVEKEMNKIDRVQEFTARIIDNGNEEEFLMVKNLICRQLEILTEHVNLKTICADVSLQFVTNMDDFTKVTKKSFGYVKDPDMIGLSSILDRNSRTVENMQNNARELFLAESNSAADGLLQSNAAATVTATTITSTSTSAAAAHNARQLAISIVSSSGSLTTNTISMQSSPVTSSPLSMPSSFDGDMNFASGVTPQTPPLDGLTTLGEINLTRLATIACNEKQNSSPSSPPPPPPPPPPIASVTNVTAGFPLDFLGGATEIPSNLLSNIQALAKLGISEGAEIMSDGYGNVNGINSSDVMPSPFEANVEASSVLDLVNRSAIPMNNGHSHGHGHVATFETTANHFLPPAQTNGVESGSGSSGSSSIIHNSGLNHHNGGGGGGSGGYSTYARSNSQRVAALEIHFKFGQLGSTSCQFGSPHGFCIGEDDAIVVADTNNHRIQVFNKDGEFRTQFGMAGKLEGQLWYPRKVEILPTGNFVICDRGNERSRLQLFSRDGLFMKKIRLKYVDIVAGMTVTEDGEIVIVDSVQPSLYKLDEHGSLSTWFDCKGVMTEPSDIAVKDQKFYICDFKGHCVVVFSPDGHFLSRIGNQGLTDYPNGIDVLPNGNILVGDSHGNKFHICIFLPDGSLLCEYECPYVKVSRCCGLKITSEGCIVTVAKNNHHVLVLKSPFH